MSNPETIHLQAFCNRFSRITWPQPDVARIWTKRRDAYGHTVPGSTRSELTTRKAVFEAWEDLDAEYRQANAVRYNAHAAHDFLERFGLIERRDDFDA